MTPKRAKAPVPKPRRASEPPPPSTALLHAKVLVASHGALRAREIAKTNASFDEAAYWASVLRAIDQLALAAAGGAG
jgi:hypothetical protein